MDQKNSITHLTRLEPVIIRWSWRCCGAAKPSTLLWRWLWLLGHSEDLKMGRSRRLHPLPFPPDGFPSPLGPVVVSEAATAVGRRRSCECRSSSPHPWTRPVKRERRSEQEKKTRRKLVNRHNNHHNIEKATIIVKKCAITVGTNKLNTTSIRATINRRCQPINLTIPRDLLFAG